MQKHGDKAGSVDGDIKLGKYKGRRQPGFVLVLYYNLLRRALPFIIMCLAHSLR